MQLEKVDLCVPEPASKLKETEFTKNKKQKTRQLPECEQVHLQHGSTAVMQLLHHISSIQLLVSGRSLLLLSLSGLTFVPQSET